MRRPHINIGAILGLIAIVCVSSAAGAGDDETAVALGRAVKRFAAVKTVRASFREEKHITLLKKPLVSSGKVYFDAAGRAFARHATSPKKSALVLRGNELVVEENGKRQSTNLRQNPIVATLAKGVRDLLSGKIEQLKKDFTLSYTEKEKAGVTDWQITMKPRDKQLKRLVKSLRVDGRNTDLLRLSIFEVNGDKAITTFSESQLDKPFSKAEQKAFFFR